MGDRLGRPSGAVQIMRLFPSGMHYPSAGALKSLEDFPRLDRSNHVGCCSSLVFSYGRAVILPYSTTVVVCCATAVRKDCNIVVLQCCTGRLEYGSSIILQHYRAGTLQYFSIVRLECWSNAAR